MCIVSDIVVSSEILALSYSYHKAVGAGMALII